MKKEHSFFKIILALLAVILMVSVFLTGCTSSNNSAMPEELQKYLKSIANETYKGADYSQEGIQNILGVCNRTLTQKQLDETINVFDKVMSDEGDTETYAPYFIILYQLKDLNRQLDDISAMVNKETHLEDKEAMIENVAMNNLSDMILDEFNNGLFSAVDGLKDRGYFTNNCDELKTAITQDLITALAIQYNQDEFNTSEIAKVLYDSLTGQWITREDEEGLGGDSQITETQQEEITETQQEEKVSAEDQARYAPEGGVFGDLLTEEQKIQLITTGSCSDSSESVNQNNTKSKTGSLSVPNIQNTSGSKISKLAYTSFTVADNENNTDNADNKNNNTDNNSKAVDYNNYLSTLLEKSGKTHKEILTQDVDTVGKENIKLYSLSENGNSVTLIKREKKTEKTNIDLSKIFANTASIYPGAILYANQNLMDGNPSEVIGLKRNPLTITNDLNYKTVTVEGDAVKKTSMDPAVDSMISDNSTSKEASLAAAEIIECSSEAQVNLKLGVSGAGEKWGIDFEACKSGKKQTELIVCRQIYYSVTTDSLDANKLIDSSVTEEEMKKVFYDSNEKDRLGGVYVNQIQYGRLVVIKLETDSTDQSVMATWNSQFGGGNQALTADAKKILANTKYSVYVYGGSTNTYGELLTCSDFSTIKEIIARDRKYDGTFKALPIAYSTKWLDNGDPAAVNTTSTYVKTSVEEHGAISVDIENKGAYAIKSQELMGRKLKVDSNNNLTLGPWEQLYSAKSGGKKHMDVSGAYVAFGYSFDINWGTDWPFSEPFWNQEKGYAKTIKITTGKTCRNASIDIVVNGQSMKSDSNCSSHSHYNWGSDK